MKRGLTLYMKRPHPRADGVSESRPKIEITKRLAEIAAHYGFEAIESPAVTKRDLDRTREVLEVQSLTRERLGDVFHLPTRVSLIRSYFEKELIARPQPVMLYHEERGGQVPHAVGTLHCSLDVVGTTRAIAEATLLKAAREILRESGHNSILVGINSIGDRDSMSRFTREVSVFFRKHLDSLHPSCRPLVAKDPFEIIPCKHEKCRAIVRQMPDAVGCLTEPSRAHLEEVLEFLERLELPYEIDRCLHGNRRFQCHTVFEIRDAASGECLGLGLRYNDLSRKLGFKKSLGAAGLTLRIHDKKQGARGALRGPAPSVYFIQLGFEAKLKSLDVIEILRREKIRVTQSLAKDKMIGQIQIAENLGLPITLIMGQKEAIEQTIIVRDMKKNAQETVPMSRLATYIRRLIRS